MAQRIKGQEVRVVMTGPNGTETALSDVQSCEITFQREVLSEDYLGETSQRKDDIFRGIAGNMEIHIESQGALAFIQAVNDRSKRRTPSTDRFNVIVTLSMPNGDRPRILLEDVFFGEIGVNTGSREEYVAIPIPFECSDGRFLFS